MKKILVVLFVILLFPAINIAKKPVKLTASIETDKGIIELEFYGDKAPLTVFSFVNLASRGYFDGISYHRVVPGFVIQGGDPTGTGSGGPGYQFGLEVNKELKHSAAGILSMARTNDPNSNGSQYFITLAPTPNLDMQYTVFGKVTKGLDVVLSIKQGDKMNKITVKGDITPEMKALQAKVNEWNKILTKKFTKLRPVVYK